MTETGYETRQDRRERRMGRPPANPEVWGHLADHGTIVAAATQGGAAECGQIGSSRVVRELRRLVHLEPGDGADRLDAEVAAAMSAGREAHAATKVKEVSLLENPSTLPPSRLGRLEQSMNPWSQSPCSR